jgi:Fe-S-cluster containining protein
MGVRNMIVQHFCKVPNYAIAIDTNREEIIPKIVEILQHFKCDLCASCCRNAGIDLSPDEAVEILRIKGIAYFDMLDINAVRDRLKAPCGLLEGKLCSVYEKRPMSCKVYPFAWVKRGLLLLYQCPMGRKVTAELLKFAEMSGFKVEKAEPEKEAAAIGLDGKVITAAIVPYTLVRQYYESLKLNTIPIYIRDKI